jgi:hypothetical protein
MPTMLEKEQKCYFQSADMRSVSADLCNYTQQCLNNCNFKIKIITRVFFFWPHCVKNDICFVFFGHIALQMTLVLFFFCPHCVKNDIGFIFFYAIALTMTFELEFVTFELEFVTRMSVICRCSYIYLPSYPK